MKKITSLFIGLLLALSFNVFAENESEYVASALTHAKAAVEHGKMGHAPVLVEHAKAALEDTLAAALLAKGPSKTHIEAASASLEEAIEHGNMGHVEMATKPAEAAVEHLKAAQK